MAVSYSTAVRIGMLQAIETAIGAGPSVIFYAGTKPSTCADALVGGTTTVATLVLNGNSGDWMSDASAAGNVVTKVKHPSSTWSATAAAAATVTFYRILSSGGTVHEQGTVTATGGGGDMTIDNPIVAVGQTITVTGKTITAGNA
jgi:hypothetical protein